MPHPRGTLDDPQSRTDERASLVFRALTGAAATVPGALIPALAGALAPIHLLVFPARRRAVLANLSVAAPGGRAARLALALRIAASYNAFLVEFLRLERLAPAGVRARVSVRGAAHWEAARARGRGVVFTTSHVGNWEWGAAWLASHGTPVTAVAGTQLSAALDPHVRAMKRRHGVEVVAPGDGYRALYRRLQAGGVVGLVIDGDVFDRGRALPLFGRATRLGHGAARLAHATGAPLLYGTITRVGGMRFAIEIEPPIGGLAPERCTVEDLDQQLRAIEQRRLAAHIDQWCLFRPLWPHTAAAAPQTT